MGILDRLPTLSDRPAFSPQPKSATPSRLQQKDAKDKDDTKRLKVWRDEVIDRDEHACRHCACRVIRTLSLHPRRFEAHHIAGRDDKAVRHDTRNALTLCRRCHERVTGLVNDKLTIVGTAWFTKGGTRYVNADFPVTFRPSR